VPIFLKVISQILKWICFLLAILSLGLVIFAFYECNGCRGPAGDVWLMVLIYGVVGLPAVLIPIIILFIEWINRRGGPEASY
jgi:hypothetical protein